ncbi:DNA-binding response regulator, LytR/AlgR family [Spirosomataceae bacterium TFI 002]|nr:DNA-binding response regulator, LytR/AlgR family [Spirosomataceae bacterium TFI 002]
MLKVGIVEDELIIADSLRLILQKMGYEVDEPVASFREGLEMFENFKPDLVLLDINIKGEKDGVDLAWILKTQYNIPFIFLTANSDKATIERVKETEPPAFLVKPFDKDELYATIEICFSNFNKQLISQKGSLAKESIFVKDNNFFVRIRVADIIYLESSHVYVNIYLVNTKYVVRNSLSQLLELINSTMIQRVHRSYAVNFDHVSAINSDHIILNEHTIPLSKSYRDEILQKIKLS